MITLEIFKCKLQAYDVPFLTDDYSTTSTYAIDSDKIIEDSVKIRNSFQYEDVFSFVDSSAELRVVYEGNVVNALDLSYIDRMHQIVVRIKRDSIPEYLGIIDSASSYYNKIDNTLHISLVGIYGWAYNILKDRTHDLVTYGNSLEEFLIVYNPLQASIFGDSERVYINVSPSSLTIKRDEFLEIQNQITYGEFIMECQKYYNAYLYINGYGTLIFISKNNYKGNAGAIDEYILDEEYSITYYDSTYDSIMTNGFDETGVPGLILIGWRFAYILNGYLYILVLQNDLSNIPDGREYLDLRQYNLHPSYQNDYSPLHRVFEFKSPSVFYKTFREVLNKGVKKNVTCYGVDFKPSMRCTLDSETYIIMAVDVEYNRQTSNLELMKLLDENINIVEI